jgi:zinc transporter ZupT
MCRVRIVIVLLMGLWVVNQYQKIVFADQHGDRLPPAFTVAHHGLHSLPEGLAIAMAR